jgi:hypothetical protein
MTDLFPITTKTTTERQHPGDAESSTMVVVETEYRLESTDRVWLGHCGVTIERGNRYNDDKESILRINNYSEDLIADAVIEYIRTTFAGLDDSSKWTRERSKLMTERIRMAIPAERVTLPGEPVAA